MFLTRKAMLGFPIGLGIISLLFMILGAVDKCPDVHYQDYNCSCTYPIRTVIFQDRDWKCIFDVTVGNNLSGKILYSEGFKTTDFETLNKTIYNFCKAHLSFYCYGDINEYLYLEKINVCNDEDGKVFLAIGVVLLLFSIGFCLILYFAPI